MVVGFSNSTDCVIYTGTKAAKINKQEDGDFLVESRLDNFTLKKLADLGVIVDESFYVDYELNKNQKIRLFKNRKNLNRISIVSGNKLNYDDENKIVIDFHFGEVNNMAIGEYMKINNEKYMIVGYGVLPDYTQVKEKIGDVIPSPENFGIGFISDSDFEEFDDICYSYAYKSNGVSAEKIKNIINRNANLNEFIEAKDNPRIRGYIDDSLVNKNVSMIVGVILFVMIITLFFGIFISTFLLVFGISVHSTLIGYINDIKEQSNFKYSYILKMPVEITENKSTEKITVKNLSYYYSHLGQDMDVVLEGIKEDSNFFDFNIKDNDSGVYISKNVSKKFNLKTGDNIVLKDTAENRIYTLKIKGTVKYASGLYVFMNKQQLNSLLDESLYYFNGYLSENKLNINKDYIYSVVTNENIEKSASNIVSIMMPTVAMIIILSIVLFIISMYLLLKMAIDKSELSISLVKIFGFNRKELNKLYLGSSLYTVIFSGIVSVPITLRLLRIIYPNIIANVSSFRTKRLHIYSYCNIGILFCKQFLFKETCQ